MNYQGYEDYMKEVVGNQSRPSNTMQSNMRPTIEPANVPNDMQNSVINRPNTMQTNIPTNMPNIPSNMQNVPGSMQNTQNMSGNMQNIPNTMQNNIPSNVPSGMNDMYYNTYGEMPDASFYDGMGMYDTGMMENADELIQMYPEIYRIIYPMVQKICNQNMNRRITKEDLERMVNEVYQNVEPNETQMPTNTTIRPQMRNVNSKELDAKNETRVRNFLMEDLIRILLLRELIGPRRRPHFPHRPGGPFMPGRPPFRPRGYDGLY
jgi:hypothetical protein